MNLKELFEKRNDLMSNMQDILDRAKAENRSVTAEEKEQFDKIDADLKDVEDTIAIEDRMSKLEKKEPKQPESVEARERQQFENMIRFGFSNADANTTKGDNGAVIPSTIANQIIKAISDRCPVYAMANKFSVKGGLSLPYKDETNSTLAVGYAAEFSALDATKEVFASITLGEFLMESLCKVSKSLINNSQFDLVNFIINDMADKFAGKIEHELLVGTDSYITGLSDISASVTAAATSAVTADELITLQDKVKDAFQNNTCWVMSRATRTAIRTLKDSENRYMLNPDFASSFGYTLLGKPVYCSDNMPNMAASAKSIIYGDLSGLAVNTSEEMNITLLREKYAVEHALGIVGFVGMDAKVQDQQKLAKLVQHA